MNMKRLSALLVVPLFSFSLSMVSFAEMNTQQSQTTQQPQATEMTQPASVSPTQQDNRFTTWLIVLDQNEIAAAKLALSHSKNPEVKKYAQTMIKDHTKNLKESQALMKKSKQKMVDTAEVKSLKEEGKKEGAKLKSLKDKQFDVEYINAMVAGHTEALQALDQDIAQLPDNSPIKAHLQATRQAVSAHLEKAKEINNSLG